MKLKNGILVSAIFLGLTLTVFVKNDVRANELVNDENQNIEKTSLKIYMEITKGLQLCKEFHEILQLSENSDVLMTPEQAEVFFEENTPHIFILNYRKIYKQVIIPKHYKKFKNPKWMAVSDKEAYEKLGDFIERWKYSRQFSLEYKKDYVLEKSYMDIDRDGKAGVLYRQKGGDYYFQLGAGNNRIRQRGNEDFFDHNRMQTFYFKGKPYFIRYSITGISISEPRIRTGYSGTDAPNSYHFWIPTVCRYSTNPPLKRN